MPETKFANIDGQAQIAGWIQNGINKDCINYSDGFGRYLKDNFLTTNQIRNAYGEVKRIQMKGEKNFIDADLLLLKPKLSYAKARKSGVGNKAAEAADSLMVVLSRGIDAVFEGDAENKYQRFENFAKFFEAILAYHKSYGGK